MTSPDPQMKPQDVVIYKLGELGGLMPSVQTSITQATALQATDSAENKREHAEFRKTLGDHGSAIVALQAVQPVRISPWSKAGVVVAIPASAVALIGFIIFYLNPTR